MTSHLGRRNFIAGLLGAAAAWPLAANAAAQRFPERVLKRHPSGRAQPRREARATPRQNLSHHVPFRGVYRKGPRDSARIRARRVDHRTGSSSGPHALLQTHLPPQPPTRRSEGRNCLEGTVVRSATRCRARLTGELYIHEFEHGVSATRLHSSRERGRTHHRRDGDIARGATCNITISQRSRTERRRSHGSVSARTLNHTNDPVRYCPTASRELSRDGISVEAFLRWWQAKSERKPALARRSLPPAFAGAFVHIPPLLH